MRTSISSCYSHSLLHVCAEPFHTVKKASSRGRKTDVRWRKPSSPYPSSGKLEDVTDNVMGRFLRTLCALTEGKRCASMTIPMVTTKRFYHRLRWKLNRRGRDEKNVMVSAVYMMSYEAYRWQNRREKDGEVLAYLSETTSIQNSRVLIFMSNQFLSSSLSIINRVVASLKWNHA